MHSCTRAQGSLALIQHVLQAGWLAAMRNCADALQQVVHSANCGDASEEHARLAASLGSTLTDMAVLSRAGGSRQ